MVQHFNKQPEAAEVRAELDRLVTSEPLRSSPNLIAFLQFVVSEALSGNTDRIRANLIGILALGRRDDFDPVIDPIVRVEATRLRRALQLYYADTGLRDPVIIDLPRGSYIPIFRHNAAPNVAVSSRAQHKRKQSSGNGMPLLAVAQIEAVGLPKPGSVSVAEFTDKLCDAFARFDSINVILGPRAEVEDDPAPDYLVRGSIDYHEDGSASLRLRLLDVAHEVILWSQEFAPIPATADRLVHEEAVVIEIANRLLDGHGVVHANGRARFRAAGGGDPRYLGYLEFLEFVWSFQPDAHARARDLLEKLTARNPTFSQGFAALALLYVLEIEFQINVKSGEPSLDRAFTAVRRALELKPESSCAYRNLACIQYMRRDFPASLATFEKAISCNPYDLSSIHIYGSRLIMLGQLDRGLELLNRGTGLGSVRPSFEHSFLFFGYYLKGDLSRAAYHAAHAADFYPMGPICSSILAIARKTVSRSAALEQLIENVPNLWRVISNAFPPGPVRDRLLRDLGRAGLICPPDLDFR